jgi:hypothetical protein
MIYCRIEFHIPVSSGLFIAVIEPTAEENSQSSCFFFFTVHKFYRIECCRVFRCLWPCIISGRKRKWRYCHCIRSCLEGILKMAPIRCSATLVTTCQSMQRHIAKQRRSRLHIHGRTDIPTTLVSFPLFVIASSPYCLTDCRKAEIMTLG